MVLATDLKSIVLSDGTDLYYDLRRGTNNNLPIVFVHGWAGSGADWDSVVQHYTAQGDTCLVYDAVGFGRSQFPSKKATRQADFSIDRYVADLLALLDAEGLQKVRLVGHSWGGVIAMTFAQKHPTRVANLIAMGAAYFDPTNRVHLLFKWISWLMAWLIVFLKPLLRRFRGLRRVAVRRYTFRPLSQEQGEAIMQDVVASDNRAIVQTLRTGYEVRFKQLCPAIAVPTFYIGGDKDAAAPLQFVKPFVDLTPGSSYGMIADCGHFPMFEDLPALIKLIDNFWSC